MEGIVFLGLLFVFGYPFLVYLMASAPLRRRVGALEDDLKAAHIELQTLRERPPQAPHEQPASAPATMPVQPRAPAAATPPPAPPVPAPAAPAAPEQSAPASPVSQPLMPTGVLDAALPPAAPAINPDPAPVPAQPDTVLPAKPPAAVVAPLFAEAPRLIVPVAPAAAAVAAPPASTASSTSSSTAASAAPAAQAPKAPRTPAPPSAPAWLRAAKDWLFTGNLVAKLGLLILFIGVSFMLKYAAERVTVPIELRLAGIVIADIALLVWGWRMRLTRRSLSLPIQGAGLAILMLVTFGAFRIYHLIPSGLAFGLLFVLTAFTCILAVLQNAVWLAVFGIAGGFVSPILTSTGQASHVALFSYYALLNAGVLAIALKRTWRALNLLGFAFTFVIGTTWGVLRYSAAEHYLTTQLFLLLFFAFYVAIAVVYAIRQSVQIKAYVDATLVFGTPLAAFALQLALMKDVQFGTAWSSLGFGLFYTALALALWRRRGSGMQLLVESFLALGVVFGTLAIPFALDGRWTSAAWALEGAGVVWVALRQQRRLAFWFGMLVQAGAWVSFAISIAGLTGASAQNANLWLGFLILAASAFFMAITLRKHKDEPVPRMQAVATAFLAFAGIWLLAGAWTEILLRQDGTAMANLLVVSGLVVAAILAAVALSMRWKQARVFSLVAQLLTGVTLLGVAATSWDWSAASPELFGGPLLGAMLIFGGAFATAWNLWRSPQEMGLETISRMMLAWSAFWMFGPILSTLSGWIMLHLPPTMVFRDDDISVYLLCLPLVTVGAAALARRTAWPELRWVSAASWLALPASTGLILEHLYFGGSLPHTLAWLAFGITWATGEFMMRTWAVNGWSLPQNALRAIHLVRTAGPWIMLWKVGALLINEWLLGANAHDAMLAEGGWPVSASWANFVPAWAMMAFVVWLIGRTRTSAWPTAPITPWYQRVLIPAAALWSLALAALWNLFQDGSMAPLPYVPLLNPLDLTTAFALALAAFTWKMLKSDPAVATGPAIVLLNRAPLAGAVAAYLWFNLILLRTASHILDIEYSTRPLFASQEVQAMLSLVWSITALVLMRWATRRASRGWWLAGAAIVALVVGKLFLVDLASSGSVARIVSFVGVGVLMVLIGYLAPYPNDDSAEAAQAQPEAQ